MNTEDKQLLLRDLCARLPYGIKCHEDNVEYSFDIIGTTTNNEEFIFSDGYERSLEQIKPYLRPMSSMTEEELSIIEGNCVHLKDGNWLYESVDEITTLLNSHYLDYRGLIVKGLALEAPEGMYNINKK